MIMCTIVWRNLYLGIFEFPIKGISLILGNDLAGSKVMPDLQRVSDPTATMGINAVESSIFPSCAVTIAAAKRAQEKANETSVTVDTGVMLIILLPPKPVTWPQKMALQNTFLL